MLGKRHEALHELGASAVALRAIVQINEQGRDVSKALFDALPPVDQAIHQAIAGDFGRHPIEKEFIGRRQEKAHRRHWLKVVVGGLGEDATLATTGERADLDRGLGIHRNP